MPKGAVLHCHMDATVDASWVVKRVLQEPNMHMLASAPLSNPATLFSTDVQFRLLSKEVNIEADEGHERASSLPAQNIFAESYKAMTWIPLQQLASHFPHGSVYQSGPLPGLSDFEQYLHSLLTLTPVKPTFGPPIKTSKQAWKKFLETFGVIRGLITNQAILKDYMVKSFETYIADSVSYIEPRINFFFREIVNAQGYMTSTHADMMIAFGTALKEVKSKSPHFDAKVIYSTVRIIDNETLKWYIQDAISLKQQFPHLLVGFDLVGHEDSGLTLREYAPELLEMKQRVKELELDFPLVLHAGETTSDGDETDDNLYDAILLGTKRIGHGFSLIKHPHLINLVKEKGICVESCPISNQILRFASSTAVHPILPLLARSVPIVIANDDSTQFDNAGLSPDFYQLLSASDHITLSSIGVLARNSIKYSIMGKNQKEIALEKWDVDWAVFVEKVASQSI